jgi:uncharacterized protein YhbP (UPF0306 family)
MSDREDVIAYLQTHQVMTIATVGEEGAAAAAVFYASNEIDLYFLSAPHTRHCRNMQSEPRVAITIHEDYKFWRDIRGLQIHALGRELSGEQRTAAEQLYVRKFPWIADTGARMDEIALALPKVQFYELITQELRFIDNTAGLGTRQEWSRSEFQASGRGAR